MYDKQADEIMKTQVDNIMKTDEEKKKMSIFKSFLFGFIIVIGVLIILSLLFISTFFILTI